MSAMENVGRVIGLEAAIVACDLDCAAPRGIIALDDDATGAARRRGATKEIRICLDVNMVEGGRDDGRSRRVWGLNTLAGSQTALAPGYFSDENPTQKQ